MDLRAAYYHDSTPDMTVSAVLFTAHAGGDFAAALGQDSTWVTGQVHDMGSDPGDLDADLRSLSEAEPPVRESG